MCKFCNSLGCVISMIIAHPFLFAAICVLFITGVFYQFIKKSTWAHYAYYTLTSWFIAGLSLIICNNKSSVNWVADWINSAVAIGTIVLAIMAIYAATSYMKQRVKEYKWSKKVDMKFPIIIGSITELCEVFIEADHYISQLRDLLQEKSTLHSVLTSDITRLQSFLNEINLLLISAQNNKEESKVVVKHFAALSILGSKRNSIQELAECIFDLQKALGALIQYMQPIADDINEIIKIIQSKNSTKYKEVRTRFINSIKSTYDIKEVDIAFKSLTEKGHNLIFED